MFLSLLNSSFCLFSPNVLSTLAQVHHGSGSSSSSPVGNGFITKESFGAKLSSRTTPMKTPLKARRDGRSQNDIIKMAAAAAMTDD